MKLVIIALVVALTAATVGVLYPRESSAFTVDPVRRIVEIGPDDSIQEAIDYAASQGAYQVYTRGVGTTEQHGEPWIVMLTPGTYFESGIVTRSGVNISSYGERTVLIFSDNAQEPVLTCASNTTISGITIEQHNAWWPAVHVVDGAVQCSVHRSIISGRHFFGESVRVSGGIMRMFDTDIRNGKVVLEPTTTNPSGEPVGFNCVRCRIWHDDFIVKGNKRALYLFQDSSFGFDQTADGRHSILSTHTGNVSGHILGASVLKEVQVTGTYQALIRDTDIELLTVAAGAKADLYGNHIGEIAGDGLVVVNY